jgi:hypothetical protein
MSGNVTERRAGQTSKFPISTEQDSYASWKFLDQHFADKPSTEVPFCEKGFRPMVATFSMNRKSNCLEVRFATAPADELLRAPAKLSHDHCPTRLRCFAVCGSLRITK